MVSRLRAVSVNVFGMSWNDFALRLSIAKFDFFGSCGDRSSMWTLSCYSAVSLELITSYSSNLFFFMNTRCFNISVNVNVSVGCETSVQRSLFFC